MNRNTRKPEYTFADCLNPQAREMMGFLELDMKNDALKIAEQILSSEPLAKHEFLAALEVILCCEYSNNCHAHKHLIATGFTKLSKAEQRDACSMVFHFYYFIDEVEIAADYIPQHYVDSGILRARMFALLELGRFKQAKRILRIARQQLKETYDDEERDTLREMFAEYDSFIKHKGFAFNVNRPTNFEG
jgi:tetratricopeptide (TPR) repeat protein